MCALNLHLPTHSQLHNIFNCVPYHKRMCNYHNEYWWTWIFFQFLLRNLFDVIITTWISTFFNFVSVLWGSGWFNNPYAESRIRGWLEKNKCDLNCGSVRPILAERSTILWKGLALDRFGGHLPPSLHKMPLVMLATYIFLPSRTSLIPFRKVAVPYFFTLKYSQILC